MRVALLVVVLAIALSQASARFGGVGFGGRFGGLGGFGFGRGLGFGGLGFGRGLGLGWGLGGFGRWGGLGWGLGWGGPWGLGMGWGLGPWGRFGLGWGGPWGRFGLGLGAFGAFNPLLNPAIATGIAAPIATGIATPGLGVIGKRAVDEEVVVPSGERTLCSFTTKKNILSCNGPKHHFECEVVPHFVGLNSPSYRVHNLTVVPETIKVSSTEHSVYRLFSFRPEDNVVNRFTLIEKPERRVTFSVYRSESVKENGLRISDETCWTSFNTMVKEVRPEHVRFALFISQVTPVV